MATPNHAVHAREAANLSHTVCCRCLAVSAAQISMSAALMYGNFSMCAALILHLTPSCSGGVLFVLTRRALMQPVRLAACTGCLSAETSRRRLLQRRLHRFTRNVWQFGAGLRRERVVFLNYSEINKQRTADVPCFPTKLHDADASARDAGSSSSSEMRHATLARIDPRRT